MENTARFSRELPQIAQRVQHSADAFDHTLATINATGVNANRTLDDTHQFTSETLPDIQQMVSELRDLSLSLRRISSELEKDPSVLLYGKTPLPRGPGE
jgi:phospholipid/cholesterol/gamma-HCH transport system substrate-binding protein